MENGSFDLREVARIENLFIPVKGVERVDRLIADRLNSGGGDRHADVGQRTTDPVEEADLVECD